MNFLSSLKIKQYERGLRFVDGEFRGILPPGMYHRFDPTSKEKVEVVSTREVFLLHPELDVIVKSGALGEEATVVDLDSRHRAIVWVDGRYHGILEPGLYALWKVFHRVDVEVVDASGVRVEHKDLHMFFASDDAIRLMHRVNVSVGNVGLFFKEGEYAGTLEPGIHLFWKNISDVEVQQVDMKEWVMEVSGQEIMTADKVTLRMNALVFYRIVDPLKSVMAVDDARDVLYREAQLSLRELIGGRELEVLLSDKQSVSEDLRESLGKRSVDFGIEVASFGIRDVILPGDMKELMNKVMEAKKAAEANLISRREETAAMRSQANTAKLLEANPTLMKLRELEVLEKISGNSKLQVVLGEKGLADRIVNLL
ncbi:MAG: slipin family protein [candidate division Zixibacteria bacterium]|nr:slipin family protein [candidate division Zixibacteria bacterium]